MLNQPAAHVPVPDGATHWANGYVYPFEKHITVNGVEERYIFTGEWEHQDNHPRYGYRAGALPIQKHTILPTMPRVITKDGIGWLAGHEPCDNKRVLVLFDNTVTRYEFSPVAYFPNEVTVQRSKYD